MNLELNSTISNKDIANIFLCSNQGGIRKSKKTNTVVVIAKFIECTYKHERIDNTLYFMGMGKIGDQELKRGNKVLVQAKSEGFSVHLFEVYNEGEYIYKGEVYISEEITTKVHPDKNGNNRNVYIFPLKNK